jgi:hypothetical protein
VYIVGFLKLLSCDIRELRFRHQRLSFGADELLFEYWDLGRFRLLVLELLDFVLNLRCVMSISGSTRLVGSILTLVFWLRVG